MLGDGGLVGGEQVGLAVGRERLGAALEISAIGGDGIGR